MDRIRTTFGIMLTALLLFSASGLATGAQDATPESVPNVTETTAPTSGETPQPPLPDANDDQTVPPATETSPESELPEPIETGEKPGDAPAETEADDNTATGSPADGSTLEEPAVNDADSTPEPALTEEVQSQQEDADADAEEDPAPEIGPQSSGTFLITAFTCAGYLEASIPEHDSNQVEFRADAADGWPDYSIYVTTPTAGIYSVNFGALGIHADAWTATVIIYTNGEYISVSQSISGCATEAPVEPEWPDEGGMGIAYATLDCSGLLTIKHTRDLSVRIDLQQTIDVTELFASRTVTLAGANTTQIQFDLTAFDVIEPEAVITDLNNPFTMFWAAPDVSRCYDPLEGVTGDDRVVISATCTGDISVTINADLTSFLTINVLFPPSNAIQLGELIWVQPGQQTYAHTFDMENNPRDLRISVTAQTADRTIQGYQYVDCSHLQPPPPTEFPIVMEGVICPRSECWLANDEREWTARFTITGGGDTLEYVVPVWSDGRFGEMSEALPVGTYDVCLDNMLTTSNGETQAIASAPRCKLVTVNDDPNEEWHDALFVMRGFDPDEPPVEETPTPTVTPDPTATPDPTGTPDPTETPVVTPEPKEAVLSTSLTVCSDADCSKPNASQANGYTVEWAVTNENLGVPDGAPPISLSVTGVVEDGVARGASEPIPVGTYRVCLSPVLTGAGGEALRIADEAMCDDVELNEDGTAAGDFTVILDSPDVPEEPEEPTEPEEPETPSPLEQIITILFEILRRLFRGFFP